MTASGQDLRSVRWGDRGACVPIWPARARSRGSVSRGTQRAGSGRRGYSCAAGMPHIYPPVPRSVRCSTCLPISAWPTRTRLLRTHSPGRRWKREGIIHAVGRSA